jgi:hypothetical protein
MPYHAMDLVGGGLLQWAVRGARSRRSGGDTRLGPRSGRRLRCLRGVRDSAMHRSVQMLSIAPAQRLPPEWLDTSEQARFKLGDLGSHAPFYPSPGSPCLNVKSCSPMPVVRIGGSHVCRPLSGVDGGV